MNFACFLIYILPYCQQRIIFDALWLCVATIFMASYRELNYYYGWFAGAIILDLFEGRN